MMKRPEDVIEGDLMPDHVGDLVPTLLVEPCPSHADSTRFHLGRWGWRCCPNSQPIEVIR